MTLESLRWKRLAGWSARLLLAGLLALTLRATPVRAAGVVSGSCTEADLNSALAGAGLITFSCGAVPHTIVLTSQKVISNDTTIDGGGLITLSGGDSTRLFEVDAATLTLNNLVLANGYSGNDSGGALYELGGNLILNHSTLQNSHTLGGPGLNGGAIIGYMGAITLTNSLVQHNYSYNYGAISTDGDLVIQHRQIVSNVATLGGGGVDLRADGHSSISDSQLISDTALPIGSSGGGIYNSGALTLTNVGLSDNQANLNDGGVFNNSAATLLVINSSAVDNSAQFGGGFYNTGQAVLTNDTLDGNSAISQNGGGIYNDTGATLTVNNSTLRSNWTFVLGGGIYNAGTATLTISTLFGNYAGESGRDTFPGAGGGILNASGATLLLTNSTLSGNTAVADPGGGIYDSGTATLTNDTLSGNSGNPGGSLYFNAGSITESLGLKNTIGTDSDDPLGGNCYVEPTSVVSITSKGFNLSSDGSCMAYLNQTGDRNSQPTLLFPLANNGGLSQTQLPQHNSPAIDHGNSLGAPSTDQRGIPRPQGGGYDIGAVEARSIDLTWPVFLALVRR